MKNKKKIRGTPGKGRGPPTQGPNYRATGKVSYATMNPDDLEDASNAAKSLVVIRRILEGLKRSTNGSTNSRKLVLLPKVLTRMIALALKKFQLDAIKKEI